MYSPPTLTIPATHLFLKKLQATKDVLMLLYAENIGVALVTEHLPVKEVAQHITGKHRFQIELTQPKPSKRFWH